MKSLVKLLLITVVIIPCFANEAAAQRPFERLQRGLDDLRPRGRILRELFGENDAEDKKREAEAAKRKAQRNQSKRNTGSPTPAEPKNNRGPAKTGQSNRGDYGQVGDSGSQNRKQAKHPTRLEFLLKESKKPKGLVVEKIAQTGAAYKAGIRRGDVLVAIGGLAVESKDDVTSITSIMKDGDQIEFEVARRGKKEKLLVQFGDPPVDGAEEGDVAPNAPSPASAANGNSALRSVLNNGDSRPTAPRGQNPYTRPDRTVATQPNWAVQPPSASNRRSPAAVQPATQRPSMNPANKSQLRDLNRQLEQQRREIEQLRRQLQQQQNQTESSDSEEDSLLDFDSD